MQAIGFNEHYGLQTAVLEKRKTMTRRQERGFDLLTETNHIFEDGVVKFYFEGSYHPTIIKPRYHVGEVLAIRQAYKDVFPDADFKMNTKGQFLTESAGWGNKMFIEAALMPHHIRITDIKVERLKDISREDCMKEGILNKNSGNHRHKKACPFYFAGGKHIWDNSYSTPRQAFAALIDKVSGKGTWERNQFMPAYTFELID